MSEPQPIIWLPTEDGLHTSWIPRFPVPDEPPYSGQRAAAVLDELWADGLAEEGSDGVRMLWPALYELTPEQRKLLGLPEPTHGIVGALESQHWLSHPDFSVKFIAMDPSSATVLLDEDRSGASWTIEGQLILAPAAVGELLNLLDQGMPADKDARAKIVGRLQALARQAGIRLDTYLSNEEYVVAEAVGVDVEVVSPEEVRLRPVAEGQGTEDFPDIDRRPGPIRSVHSARSEDGTRRRLVLDTTQQRAADAIRTRTIRGPDVARFFANPEAYLPDAVDLSRFSPRVRGLIPQRYQSQPYISVDTGNRRDWFNAEVSVELDDEASPLVDEPAAGKGSTSWPADPPTPTDAGGDAGTAGGQAPPSIQPEEYLELCERSLETGEAEQLFEGAWIHIDPERAASFVEAWNALEVDEDGNRGIPAKRVGMILDVISNTDVLEYLEEAGGLDFEPEIPEYPEPSELNATLHAHQRKGYRWLRHLDEKGWGGLLADDMGLGKTVQIISLLVHLHEKNALRPALIVAPNSLMTNWEREIRRFAPGIHLVHVHQGPHRARTAQDLRAYDVVLTTYGTLRSDQLLLAEVDWTVLALDEAQQVKNPSANVTAAAKGMKAGLRVASTGTPVENGLNELWCIVDFAQPGKLGSRKEFRDTYERPITLGEESQRAGVVRALQHRLRHHYIRRLKDEVLTDLLPKRPAYRQNVRMDPQQADLYRRERGAVHRNDVKAIAALQRMIRLCSHPDLIDPGDPSATGLLARSSKLRATMEILDQIRSLDEKAVIFTRYRDMQEILRLVILDRYGFAPRVLNGDVAGGRRQTLVDEFNRREGFRVMILSPEAAGVGLNITGANHAIHYTRLWNPAKEMQATDRIHRIGQTRPVSVYYPIVTGDDFQSVEQHLDELLESKMALAREVMIPRGLLDVSADLQRRLMEEPD